MGGHPDERRRTVALFGLFGVGNIGNEASLAAGIAALRRRAPDVSLVVVGGLPEAVEEQHGVPAVAIGTGTPRPRLWGMPKVVRLVVRPLAEPIRWLTILRFLRSVDAVVVPGTGILDDFGVSPRQMPFDLFKWTTLSRLAGRPWSMVGVGAGPIDHRASRWLMRRAVRNSAHVTYRDEVSRAFMAGIGEVPAPDCVQPDVVFALDRPADRQAPPRGGPHVGLGLMHYTGWRLDEPRGDEIFAAYVASMTEVAARLLEGGCSLRVLVGEHSDQAAVDGVLEGLAGLGRGDDRDVVVEPIADIGALLEQIARTDAVVASRFHNVVGALMLSRPTVSIGYAQKNEELMAAFGLGAYCHHIERFDAERVVADLWRVLERGEELRAQMISQRDWYRRSVEARFDIIIDELTSSSTR
jgi:polysaccharide pyruvyl transferase WcaK-like protein